MEKIILPIKTKIAAWWMIGFGVILIPLAIEMIVMFGFFFASLLLCSGLSILFGYHILRGKKWAWVVLNIILLIPISIIGVHAVWNFFYWIMYPDNWKALLFCFSPWIFLIPFILLLLDRKNFWKIAK